MSLVTPAAGAVAAALAVTGIALPVAAGPAAAACREGVTFDLSDHKRIFLSVPGTRITFTKPGTHTVEIVRRGTLTARYGTGDASDRSAILAAVRENWPGVRKAVAVTKGHQETFRSRKGERVTVTYATRGDRVRWTKLDVEADCSTTVLDSGTARFPRQNLDWLFAVAIR
jgi:hypothetical protein